jgi:multidrug transporter EmrE-like cation transporter
MNPAKIVGIILIVLGVAGLAMGSFSYTKETHEAKVGPLQLSVQEKDSVNVPQWLGIAAIALGVVLLVVPGGRK